MPELVRPGTGVVCGTYADLLAAVNKLDSIKTTDCRRSVETFFSVTRMAQDYLALFDKILKMGELDHEPRFNFDPASVKLLYKPTLANRLRLQLTGKV
jgi:argininosuccinate lyase